MGLFINKDSNPDIFKNKKSIQSPNQLAFKSDLLSEWMDEQRNFYQQIDAQINRFEHNSNRQYQLARNHHKRTESRFHEIAKSHGSRQEFEQEVLASFKKLHIKQRSLQSILTNSHSLNRDFHRQLKTLNESKDEVTNHLIDLQSLNEKLSYEVKNQYTRHIELSSQIGELEKTQKELRRRLENQDSLLEKLVRQIDNLRSIIFERSHFLIEQIDKVRKLPSSYQTRLKGSSQQSIKLQKIIKTKKSDD